MDPNDPAFTIFLGGLGGTPTMRMLVHLRAAFECGAIVGQRREAKATLPLIRSAMSMAESAMKTAEATGHLTAELRAHAVRIETIAGFAAGKVGDRN